MVNALIIALRVLVAFNDRVLRIGRTMAWISLALMVAVILAQIFFRYVLNNALPWPDEAARFLMLWMTGLIAPLAYRHGGFVAIEMVPHALKGAAAHLLVTALLLMSLCVIAVAIRFGWDHTMGFGGNFDSSSLKLPLDLLGLDSVRVKLRYMYGSLLVCMVLLVPVNLELLLRHLIGVVQPDRALPEPEPIDFAVAGSE
ncbi:TRAP transporter small permease [Zhengella sp. ZM62]|uniref:TRAP transporter small permease n=1 Tax=Zhengella sedimenti TaxID=3390035 RepID=UPI0039755908